LNGLAKAHKATGLDSPTSAGMVRNTLKGIRRMLGTAAAPKSPTLTDDIRLMVDATDAGLIGARDRALILLEFAGAFRRSELVGLDIADCAFGKDGLAVTLRRSKTDQDCAGRKVGIPYGSNPETCPVRTVQAWLECAGADAGPLFRPISRHGQVQTAVCPVSTWRPW
jgi:site-specific recombinase XerC